MKDPILELAFAGGIDQSQRAEILDPRAGFVMLENVRAPKKGAVTKRYGFGALTGVARVDATNRTAGYRMFADGKKTCIIDRDVIDVFSPDNEDQISRGRVSECGLSMMKVPAPGVGGTLTCTDSVRVGDYLALAYTAGQSVYASIVEAETGQVIVAPTLIYTGSASEIYGLLCARGSTAMIFIICSGEGDVRYSECICTSATTAYAGWSGQASFASDNGGLTMAVHSIGTRAYVAYVNNSAGASQVSIEMFDGGAGGTTTVNTSSVTPSDLALGGASGDTLWVAWNESAAVKVKGLSTTNLATVPASAATVITAANAPSFDGIAVVASATAGAGRLFVNNGNGAQLYTRNFTTAGAAVTASGSTATHWCVQMAGRPFRIGTRYYGVCRGQDSTEDVAILCDLTETNAWVRPVANVAPRLASSFFAAQAAQHTSREFWAPIGVQTAGNVTSVQMARFDFDAPYRWRPVSHNGVTFLSGGLLSYFDGVRVAESGFVIRPPAPTAVDSGGGSGLTGVYSYVAVYEQVDSAGNWHVSGVSDPVTTASITDNTMTVTVRPVGISARISAATDPSVRISIYRTVAGGEPPYYYLTSLTNTLTAATQTYADSTPDGSIATQAMLLGTGALPGTGAQQDRRAPSGMDHLVSYNGFLVGALGETVFWSGQDVSGEGAWWNPVFQQPLSGGGDVTALECHDGTIYAFKRDRVFAMAGQPPADNGGDGGLGAPVRLAVDIGASQPFTCVTSMGIFFVSERGIELLDRNRGVSFIGEGIQDTFASYPHVTSMTYDADSSCVLIECASGYAAGLGTGTGRTLVFDTRSKVWRSVDRRAVSATADVVAQDGCMVWDGSAYRYAWLRSNGASYVEDHGTKLDSGDVWIRQYGKTSQIHLAGMQGEQHIDRMLLLGDWIADHDLELGIANDYSDTFVTQDYDSDVLEALTLYVIDKDIDQKTGQAIQVEIEDATPTGSGDTTTDGKGADWIALTFAGMGKGGVRRASGAERGGT